MTKMSSRTTTGGGGSCIFLDAGSLRSLIPPSSLIPHLLKSLPSHSAAVHSPSRHIFPVDQSSGSSLLLMPSWSTSPSLPYIGVKTVTSFPHNSAANLPAISASYSLFSSSTGAHLAGIDGAELTLLRTSAVSALAARFLARDDARVLVMVGAGALAPHLIRAHRSVRPGIEKVIIWNRSAAKARDLAKRLGEAEKGGNVVFEAAEALDGAIGLGDVVSCATSSRTPVVKGRRMKPGSHLDLVGSFTPAMAECDDDALVGARLFVDFPAAMTEAGELVGAFRRGAISPEDVAGTLSELAGGGKVGRRSSSETTVFKSVGTALVDLLTAQLAYESHLSASFMDNKSKEKSYIHWSAEMDYALSNALLEQIQLGNKGANGWKSVAFTAGITALWDECQVHVSKEKIMARLKTWNKYYQEISAMLDTSGFGWDWDRHVVQVDSDEVWADYIKAHPGLKHYKDKVIVNWGDLTTLCGTDKATGANATTGVEAATEIEVEEIHVDDTEPSREQKKTKNTSYVDLMAEAVIYIAKNMNNPIEIASVPALVTTPPHTRIEKVYAALSVMPELSEDDLIKAIDMLSKDEIKCEVFLVLPELTRRSWLRVHLRQ